MGRAAMVADDGRRDGLRLSASAEKVRKGTPTMLAAAPPPTGAVIRYQEERSAHEPEARDLGQAGPIARVDLKTCSGSLEAVAPTADGAGGGERRGARVFEDDGLAARVSASQRRLRCPCRCDQPARRWRRRGRETPFATT